MTIAILGATGLTGNLCLHYLLNAPKVTKVISIGRKTTGIEHDKLSEIILFHNVLIEPVLADGFINCLGTTIKKAGSTAQFEAIDFELPVGIAKELQVQGCNCAATISAVGASMESNFLYTRTKGKMEREMEKIGFESLTIIRPSFIVGERKEKRSAEIAALFLLGTLSPFLMGSLSKYKPLCATEIAKALVLAILESKHGKSVYQHDEIQQLLKIH